MRSMLVPLVLAILVPACAASRVPVGEHDGGIDAAIDRDAGGPDGSDRDAGLDDAGLDGGWCECPAPLPGCRYVGSPCPCSAIECDDAGGPTFCGGFIGAVCAGTQFCDFTDPHQCGAADEGGTCQARPVACPEIYDPHCGCDGMTYSSACAAHAAGVDTAYAGGCGVPPPSG